MAPSEVAKLLAVIAAAYPGFEVDETRHRLWCEMVGDLDYQVAAMAVRRHIGTSRFAPTVADIREQSLAAAGDEVITAAEAWGELMQAVRRYGYYRAEEGLASLSPETRRVAEMITWRGINLSENLDVLRGQFMRMYQMVHERAQRERQLPENVREAIRRMVCKGKPPSTLPAFVDEVEAERARAPVTRPWAPPRGPDPNEPDVPMPDFVREAMAGIGRAMP